MLERWGWWAGGLVAEANCLHRQRPCCRITKSFARAGPNHQFPGSTHGRFVSDLPDQDCCSFTCVCVRPEHVVEAAAETGIERNLAAPASS
jgi:hypothetical protein